MKYEGDIGLYLSGCDVPVPGGCNVLLHQPKVRDVALFGEDKFFSACQMLSDIPKFVEGIKQGNSELAERNDFQIFVEVLTVKETGLFGVVEPFFSLCCPDFTVTPKKKTLDFIDNEGNVVGRLNQMNYTSFSRTLRELYLPKGEDEDPEYNYDKNNKAAAALAEKIKKNRERLKKAKSSENSVGSVLAFYSSCLSLGVGIDVNVFYDYTLFQLYDAFSRYMAKVESDQFRQIQLMPFSDTSDMEAPETWMRNLYAEPKQKYNSFGKFNEAVGKKSR